MDTYSILAIITVYLRKKGYIRYMGQVMMFVDVAEIEEYLKETGQTVTQLFRKVLAGAKEDAKKNAEAEQERLKQEKYVVREPTIKEGDNDRNY